MPEFVHIDIAADEPQRAADFFGEVFGWVVQKLEGPVPYWLVTPVDADGKPTGPGAGIAARELPWQSVTPTIDVTSVDEYQQRIEAAGGTIVVPKQDIPGVGQLLTFKDTEGNVFAILEPAAGNPFAPPAE